MSPVINVASLSTLLHDIGVGEPGQPQRRIVEYDFASPRLTARPLPLAEPQSGNTANVRASSDFPRRFPLYSGMGPL